MTSDAPSGAGMSFTTFLNGDAGIIKAIIAKVLTFGLGKYTVDLTSKRTTHPHQYWARIICYSSCFL